MNRRDFVSRSVSVVVANSQAARNKLFAATTSTDPRWILNGKDIRASLNADGTIRALEVMSVTGWEGVDFCSAPFAGPAGAGATRQSIEGAAASFAGTVDGIRYSLQYRIEGIRLAILAGLRNDRLSDYFPKAAQLVLGINCEMLSYPKWNDRYFPTLLRCEKTHFWGYFMTPQGRIMTVGSPDPVASYSMDYELSSWGDGGHLIHTCSIDLMHALPLPPRHPQNLVSLKSGEEQIWTIYLQPAGSLEEVKPLLAGSLSAPMIDADPYTLAAAESASLSIWAPRPVTVTAIADDGSSTPVAVRSAADGKFLSTITPQGGAG